MLRLRMSMLHAITVIFITFIQATTSQDTCKGTTCGECIQFGISCAWCSEKGFNGTRCQLYEDLKVICPETKIDYPVGSTNNVENRRLTDGEGVRSPIQISPQKVNLKVRLRDDEMAPIKMQFRAANNFPVDLYFLFDNSKSMQQYIKDLAALASNIGSSIGNISRNFQMGYGVFQDKVIMPFTDTSPLKLQNPCISSKKTDICSEPKEYEHLLTMTNNTELFTKKVQQTGFTGNLDHPEGSLDAIMQAVTCKDKIGWRNNSRKMLIFASNDRFHLAGDGRMAGIVIPNDGKCHLDGNNRYAKELEQDYPSVSQIRKVVIDNEIHILFVVKDQTNLFEKLSERVPQSVVEILAQANDTSNKNLVDIIQKKYKEMISKVEIKHTNVPGVEIEIKAKSNKCEVKDTNVCKGIQIGDIIDFEVEVKLSECPPNKEKLKIELYPESLRNDKMVLEIEPICDCQCETDAATWAVNSVDCSGGNGTLKCGLCDCNEHRFGVNCECGDNELNLGQTQCNRGGDNSTRVCSGVGKCECGVCKCNEGYSGPFCECNDLACEFYDKKICGGKRGKCDCGVCKCSEGFTGSACECTTSNVTCQSPTTGQVCSDKGECSCDKCTCQIGYFGQYCEICFACGNTVCDDKRYRQCAQCYFDNKMETCPTDCPSIGIVESLKSFKASTQCSIKQEDGCFISYQVTSSENNDTIYLQKSKTCPEPVNIIPIVAGVVGGVVAIGLLLLLLWKILTTIFDRIEYSRFQEDLKQCKWAQQDNPFYRGATTTYKNPMLDTSQPLLDN